MLCPCGNQTAFSYCCEPFISGEKIANSPEKLMRSRYSAYATKQSDYIYNTYAQTTRKLQLIDDIKAWAHDTHWVKLVIHCSSQYSSVSNKEADLQNPTVEFSAYYFHQQQLFEMRECSNFIKEEAQWRYLDGTVSLHEQVNIPKRNEPCFCHSSKKFKHCCFKNI